MSRHRADTLVGAPGVLIVSGLDPSGGAGFIADVRVAAAHGCRPVGVVTANTEQSTRGVEAANPGDPAVIAAQLTTLLTDVEVAAVKIGMLGSATIASVLADALALTRAPVVWDPVLAASAGRVALFEGDLAQALTQLVPHVTLITPNADEASMLSGVTVRDVASAEAAAHVLATRGGLSAVLVKGGHLVDDAAVDVLLVDDAIHLLSGPRVKGTSPHGTGCMLSTAIACHLSRGSSILDACRAAKEYVAERIAHPVLPGRGAAAVL